MLLVSPGLPQQYGLNVIHLMPVNLYGPGDNFDPASSHVIPALIRNAWRRATGAGQVEVWGTGSGVARVPLRGRLRRGLVVAATERYDGPEPVNVGVGREITIKDLTELIAELTGFEGDLAWDSTKPDGQPRRALDTSRARELFGFEASTALEDGLKRTIAWYRDLVAEKAAAT